MEDTTVRMINWLRQAEIAEGKTIKIMVDNNTVGEYTVPAGKKFVAVARVSGTVEDQ